MATGRGDDHEAHQEESRGQAAQDPSPALQFLQLVLVRFRAKSLTLLFIRT